MPGGLLRAIPRQVSLALVISLIRIAIPAAAVQRRLGKNRRANQPDIPRAQVRQTDGGNLRPGWFTVACGDQYILAVERVVREIEVGIDSNHVGWTLFRGVLR